MTHHEIIRSHTPLSQTAYGFYFFEDKFRVVLNYVSEHTRTTKRHKWVSTTTYARIPHHHTRGLQVEPEIPEDVKAEAIELFRSQIHFEKWK